MLISSLEITTQIQKFTIFLSWYTWTAVTEYQILNGINNAHLFCHSSGCLGIQNEGVERVYIWWGPLSSLQMLIFFLCPHMAEGYMSSRGLFVKASIPFIRAPPSWSCQARVCSSVLSLHSKDLEWWTLKPSACHSSQVLDRSSYQCYNSILFRR